MDTNQIKIDDFYVIELVASIYERAQSNECWIYDILVDSKSIMNEIKSEDFQVRECDDYGYKKVLFSATLGSKIFLDKKSIECLEVVCLNHSWSGSLRLLECGDELERINLYWDSNRLMTYKFRLLEYRK